LADICPVCSGRRETAPGQGCGACAATGFIAGFLRVLFGVATLDHGAARVELAPKSRPGPDEALVFVTIQETRGEAGAVRVSDRAASGFTICSSSERDQSIVGWLIIG
jgi:hypothetical protein